MSETKISTCFNQNHTPKHYINLYKIILKLKTLFNQLKNRISNQIKKIHVL